MAATRQKETEYMEGTLWGGNRLCRSLLTTRSTTTVTNLAVLFACPVKNSLGGVKGVLANDVRLLIVVIML